MKTQLSKLLAVSVAVLVMGSRITMGDDANANIPPAKATPGSPAESNTKTQENNPAGSATQTMAHPKEGTKKKKKKNSGAPVTTTDTTTASGDKATKTPQKDAPPSTPAQ